MIVSSHSMFTVKHFPHRKAVYSSCALTVVIFHYSIILCNTKVLFILYCANYTLRFITSREPKIQRQTIFKINLLPKLYSGFIINNNDTVKLVVSIHCFAVVWTLENYRSSRHCFLFISVHEFIADWATVLIHGFVSFVCCVMK